jgi:deoxyribodipyrimidine photo-lyase
MVGVDGPSKFSPYIRFGVMSIREIYNLAVQAFGLEKNIFVTELARREFWFHI